MSISDHDETFFGLPVVDYSVDGGLADAAGTAPRLSVGYDSPVGQDMPALLRRFLDDPAARDVQALVIGSWGEPASESSAAIVATLAEARDRLPRLKALFLGDITYDECEISWINQADVTPLLVAYPGLELFRVRGSEGLSFGPLRHEGLKSLVVESGGLPAEIVRAAVALDLPNLEHLELWLGDTGYGGDAAPDDLAPVLSAAAFPRLKSLALRDSEVSDQLAEALADSAILPRLEALDLSLGTLGDDGAVALLSSGHLSTLKRLDIHHHYVSGEVLDGLKALGIELNADDSRTDEDDEGRYVAVSE